MQAQENSNSDDSSSMAMAIDDTLPPHLKKRTLDADVPVATNSSAPSPSKIQATNTDSNCDITWSEVLQLLSPLRNYEPKFLPLQQLQLDEKWIITEETLQAIGSLRERTYMPHTFARDRFDSWQAKKVQDDCLSEDQLRTVEPINRSHDALVSQSRQLQSLLRERKKLAKSPSPDQEDLADLDAQIVVAQDDIAKARIKLVQRHTALVNDAQHYNVVLPDLVELDFRDGPA